jgi:hypothetical protein
MLGWELLPYFINISCLDGDKGVGGAGKRNAFDIRLPLLKQGLDAPVKVQFTEAIQGAAEGLKNPAGMV